MILTKTELQAIAEIGNGVKHLADLAKAINTSLSHTYNLIHTLSTKGLLKLTRVGIEPEPKTHVTLLLNLLSNAKNLSEPLSGTGMQIYTILVEPKKVKEIEIITGLHKTTVLKKINQGRRMSLVVKNKNIYSVNEKIWPQVKEFLVELKKYEEVIDNRIPINSIIYRKNDKEILFSTKEDVDAEKTAFSAYEIYGIKLLNIRNFYYLPKKFLSKKEIFQHSLYVAQISADHKDLIFVALFLLKHKELTSTKHRIVDELKKIFAGEHIAGYPTLAEIKNRAEVYNIYDTSIH